MLKKNRGHTLLQNSQYEEAITYYQLLVDQEIAEINDYFYLGLAYFLLGNNDSAEEIWMSILFTVDDFQTALDRLLNILDQEARELLNQGRYDRSLMIYQKLHELLANLPENQEQNYAIYYCNFGIALNKKGLITSENIYFIKAEKVYQYALQLNNQLIPAYNNLGNMYYLINNLQKAEETYVQQVRHNSDNLDSYYNLIGILHSRGKVNKSIKLAEDAIAKFPDDLLLRIKKHLTLPYIYQDQQEIATYRKLFNQGLKQIINDFNQEQINQGRHALQAIASHSNFLLAYQCFNHREQQKKYGKLVQQIMKLNFPQWQQTTISLPKEKEQKIRLGFISGSLHRHVVAKLSLGWFKQIDKSQFDIYTYSIGHKIDQISEQYRENSQYFYYLPNNLQGVVEQIKADQLDALIFLDIGMHPQMTLLASLRLAPIQCTTWFHPETSGLPTIDYFLSSELMETEASDSHYSETLIRLPNLAISCAHPRLPQTTKTRKDFGLGEEKIVYFCAQSLFKYLPQHDYILANIAQKVPQSQFVFIARPNNDIASLFQHRLEKAFDRLGLKFSDYCLFLSALSEDDYLRVNQLADIFLDSFGWSGGNTTLEALACHLPIVTCPGEFMRGRHSYAILKVLGVEETIAINEQDYIDIAVKLALDPSWKQTIKQKIASNLDLLYDDLECVRALEKFLSDVVNQLHN